MKTSIILLLSATTIAISCSPGTLEKAEMETNAAEPVAMANATISNNGTADLPTPARDPYAGENVKLIKTVDYQFEVANMKASTEAIETSIRKYPAYISGSNLKLANKVLENSMSIRIQSEFFHDLLKEIDAQAVFVNHREVKTTDVSKEFVDLESRLKTKREVETRYANILRNKAGTIEELFEAESKIGELHEEIEATVSRMNYLKSQVSYSTINLEYYQNVVDQVAGADEKTMADQLTKALATGWAVVVGVIIALVYLWPLYVIVGIVAMVYYLRYKRTRVV